MTSEEKQLLLIDLCVRLPYHPQCYCKWTKKAPNGTDGCVQELSTFVIDEIEIMDDPQFKCRICDVKPYLRPMSSMTYEEWKVFEKLTCGIEKFTRPTAIMCISNAMHFLAMKHIDYRELIEMELALEAPEGMYDN